MIKIRLTFVDTPKGHSELAGAIKILNDNYIVLNQSKVYKGRGATKYSNIYLDIELKGKGE